MGGKSRTTTKKQPVWRKVEDVGLDKYSDVTDKNHYDDDDNGNHLSVADDLEADPRETVGIFMGLEVLEDASAYIITRGGPSNAATTTAAAAESTDPPTEHTKKSKKKKKKTKKVQDETNNTDEEPSKKRQRIEQPANDEATEKLSRKQKKKSKTKTDTLEVSLHAKNEIANANTDVKNETALQPNEVALQQWQLQWLLATSGVELHMTLVESLHRAGFEQPTPIQAATLAASVLGRRNIVGAASTGSGKTLAFLLPIYQHLLQQQQQLEQDAVQTTATTRTPLQALILTPTRELALQIHHEGQKLCPANSNNMRIGCLTGGLAVAKQTRVLQQQPPILVATPGRLWELISSKQHAHLNDLSRIRFLVIDEADRMVMTPGSFPELAKILDAVQRANPADEEENDMDGTASLDDLDDPERMLGLPGIPGEARVTMLSDDVLQRLQDMDRTRSSADEPPEIREVDDDEEYLEQELEEHSEDDDLDVVSLPALPPVKRQTFVFSATLTLPGARKKHGKKSGGRATLQGVDGAISEIMEKARAVGQTTIVDLTNAAASTTKGTLMSAKAVAAPKAITSNTETQKYRLPPGLKLQQIKCTQLHKDSHLYAYLMTTVTGSAGPCLVFCNSIAAVRRVGATLQTLGIPVRLLHAHMQQRARFKAVESLQTSKARTVVVATDVAARGLDIPSVATVIHYDAARSIDTFVHRSGRTARGMGEGAVGCSLSLVASGEDKFHAKIVNALKVSFTEVVMDGRLLSGAQERVNLACKVASVEDTERKTQRDNQWFKDQAAEAGLEVDDDMLDNGLAGGDSRDQARLNEARLARERLRHLLAQPIQTQRFGKFLSTNSAATQRVVPEPVIMPPAPGSRKKKRRRSK